MSKKKQAGLRLSVIAAGVLCAMPAMADDFQISGFGTLGATYFSRGDADFTGGAGMQSGVGRSGRLGLGPETRGGLQLRYAPTNRLTFTVQALSKLTPRDDWRPSIEWANVKYQFNDTYAVRLGRIGHPFFMMSDYVNARYAQTALRPAQEVYGQSASFSHSDVVELLANWDVSDGMLSFQGGFGQAKAATVPSMPAVRDHDEAEVKKIAYINLNYETGPWTLRAGYTHGNLTFVPLIAQRELFDAMTNLSMLTGSPVPQQIRERFETKDQSTGFFGIGANYDDGTWVGNAEYVQVSVGKGYNSSRGWTLLAGRRIGQFTPYVRYSESDTIDRIMSDGVADQLTPLIGPQRAYVAQATIQAVLDATATKDQRTFSVGTRWDFRKNMALKAQYDYVMPQYPSKSGYLVNVAPNYPQQGKGHAVAVALDFIF